MITIRIISHAMRDGSKVYNVRLGDGAEFAAVTERDAWEMAFKLSAAIAEHSNEDVHVDDAVA